LPQELAASNEVAPTSATTLYFHTLGMDKGAGVDMAEGTVTVDSIEADPPVGVDRGSSSAYMARGMTANKTAKTLVVRIFGKGSILPVHLHVVKFRQFYNWSPANSFFRVRQG
jgi:hypothetical protein